MTIEELKMIAIAVAKLEFVANWIRCQIFLQLWELFCGWNLPEKSTLVIFRNMHFHYFITLVISLFLVILLFPYLDYYF